MSLRSGAPTENQSFVVVVVVVVEPFVCGLAICGFLFFAKFVDLQNLLFSCESDSFLHILAKASAAAYGMNRTKSRCFAAGVCRFAEFTF